MEKMTVEEVINWICFLGLSKFEDTVKYAKLDGKMMSNYTRKDWEILLGFPYDSPEVNHIFLNNKLMRGKYFKNPMLAATGYNGNNELGLTTGNNMITDYQDFEVKIEDCSDDVNEVKLNSLCSIITTLKNRRFFCIDLEEKPTATTKNQANKKEVEEESEEFSEEEEITGGKKGRKKSTQGTNKRKGSKNAIVKKLERGEIKTYISKKFEKIKWKEVTEIFEKSAMFRDYVVDTIDCSRNNMFIVCHEKPKLATDEVAKDRLITVGQAVTRIVKDPKLNCHTFDVGIRHAQAFD